MSEPKSNLLLAQLIDLPDDKLDDLVKCAKFLRIQEKRTAIPPEQIKSLKRKYDTLGEGQNISFRINPMFTFTVKVATESGMGCVVDWDVNISNHNDYDKAFGKVFGEMFKEWLEDWSRLECLDPRIPEAMKNEEAAYTSFINDRLAIRDQFGVDPDKLLEDLDG